MMALRLDMYSSTVIRSDDQPLDSPSTSGETHRKSVLLRKKAAKVLSKNFEVLGCWEGRRNPGEGEGEEKNEGVKNGDFRAETGDFRGFPREMACGNRKTSDFFDGKFRGFCHKHPMFYAKKSGVFTPSHPQFFRICRKKMYISTIQRWGNIHEIIKWI